MGGGRIGPGKSPSRQFDEKRPNRRSDDAGQSGPEECQKPLHGSTSSESPGHSILSAPAGIMILSTLLRRLYAFRSARNLICTMS
jgi:hypothetical protein